MKYFAKFLLLIVAVICLGSFSPRASAHANALPAASPAAERHNPASAHDRHAHRSSHRRHRHHHTRS